MSINYTQKTLFISMFFMAAIVVLSNYLVNIPINDWWTYGAFSYPLAFLVTDITNRNLGPQKARYVIYVGFALGVALSLLVDMRIAIASGTAFLIAQLLDVVIFNRLRNAKQWWLAPLSSSFITSAIDTALFFSIAFYATGLPWITWGIGDFAAKIIVALLALLPYRLLLNVLKPINHLHANS